MALMTWDLLAHYEDGTTESVVADQRDVAMWEVQPFGRPAGRALAECSHLLFRWLTWHALHRTKATHLRWDDWTATVVEVEIVDEPEAPDPGNPAAPDEG